MWRAAVLCLQWKCTKLILSLAIPQSAHCSWVCWKWKTFPLVTTFLLYSYIFQTVIWPKFTGKPKATGPSLCAPATAAWATCSQAEDCHCSRLCWSQEWGNRESVSRGSSETWTKGQCISSCGSLAALSTLQTNASTWNWKHLTIWDVDPAPREEVGERRRLNFVSQDMAT